MVIVKPKAPVAPEVNGATLAADTQVETMDPILYWNDIALEANRISHTNGLEEQCGPPLSARALAIVHLAMYDAYARVINDPTNLPIYLNEVPLPTPPTTAADVDDMAKAAVAAAAHKTLSTLFPGQSAAFNTAMNEAGDPTSPGHALGWQVAEAILADRENDPGAGSTEYDPPTGPFTHQADPDNPMVDAPHKHFHAPFYGEDSKVFAVTKPHPLSPPPKGDAEYVAALQEVRVQGMAPELMGTLPSGTEGRTTKETLRGIYWGYDGAAKLGTPPRFYNQIVRQIARAQNNSVAENARLFALVNVAMADAGILAWKEKYIHNLLRPIVGIRERDIDNDGDPFWLPLGAPKTNVAGSKNFTPPFPAYPSGHATFGAAALHMTRLFYCVESGDRGPDMLLDGQEVVSDEFNGVNQDNHGTVRPLYPRSFPGGLWEMIIENGVSRVDLGVHWVFDAFAVKTNAAGEQEPDLTQKDIGGVPLGLAIAEDIFNGGRALGLKKPAAETASVAAAEQALTPSRGGSWRDRVEFPPSSKEVLQVQRVQQ